MPAKVSVERARERHGRVRERRGRGEPVGGGDVGADGERDHVRPAPEQPQMTDSKPNVATNSLRSCAAPLRSCEDKAKSGNRRTSGAPRRPRRRRRRPGRPRRRALAPWEAALQASASVTAGLKWAPGSRAERQDERDEGRAGRERVREERDRDVPPASRSPMIPEPTTVASSSAVPAHSAAIRF